MKPAEKKLSPSREEPAEITESALREEEGAYLERSTSRRFNLCKEEHQHSRKKTTRTGRDLRASRRPKNRKRNCKRSAAKQKNQRVRKATSKRRSPPARDPVARKRRLRVEEAVEATPRYTEARRGRGGATHCEVCKRPAARRGSQQERKAAERPVARRRN